MKKIESEKLSSALCKEFKYNFFSKEKDQINDDDDEDDDHLTLYVHNNNNE